MKQSKRLSALLLAFCLIVSMIVPAVYAEGEDLKTVTYDFDFVGIAMGFLEQDGLVDLDAPISIYFLSSAVLKSNR